LNNVDFFKDLVNIDYRLLKNIDFQVEKIDLGKDVDIIVNKKDESKFIDFLKKHNLKNIKHPWDFGNNFIFLYSMNPFKFYKNQFLILDVCYELSCRSINAGEWIPLDKEIQDDIWSQECTLNGYVKKVSNEIELVHLITKSIFDKKSFTSHYIDRINNLINLSDRVRLNKYLNLVFFKFTPLLLKLIETNQYDKIIDKYISFKDY
jgi:hypothetical protein